MMQSAGGPTLFSQSRIVLDDPGTKPAGPSHDEIGYIVSPANEQINKLPDFF
jgi:hypothetical protein